MLNDILDAITNKLKELFPDNPVYTDIAEQNLEESCFIVKFLEPSEKPMIGPRYFRKTAVSIQYLPGDNKEVLRELNRVADILMDGMKYITFKDGSLLRGTGMAVRPDMEVRVLTFLVNYNMFVIRQITKEEPMEKLNAHTKLRRQEM